MEVYLDISFQWRRANAPCFGSLVMVLVVAHQHHYLPTQKKRSAPWFKHREGVSLRVRHARNGRWAGSAMMLLHLYRSTGTFIVCNFIVKIGADKLCNQL